MAIVSPLAPERSTGTVVERDPLPNGVITFVMIDANVLGSDESREVSVTAAFGTGDPDDWGFEGVLEGELLPPHEQSVSNAAKVMAKRLVRQPLLFFILRPRTTPSGSVVSHKLDRKPAFGGGGPQDGALLTSHICSLAAR